MKKLYVAAVTIYVIAENEDEAKRVARYDACIEEDEWEVSEAKAVDATWYDCLPWGDDDNQRTCGEWLSA